MPSQPKPETDAFLSPMKPMNENMVEFSKKEEIVASGVKPTAAKFKPKKMPTNRKRSIIKLMPKNSVEVEKTNQIILSQEDDMEEEKISKVPKPSKSSKAPKEPQNLMKKTTFKQSVEGGNNKPKILEGAKIHFDGSSA